MNFLQQATAKFINQSLERFIDKKKFYMVYNCKYDEFYPYLVEEQEPFYVFAGYVATQAIRIFVERYSNSDRIFEFHIIPVAWTTFKVYNPDFSEAISFSEIFKEIIT